MAFCAGIVVAAKLRRDSQTKNDCLACEPLPGAAVRVRVGRLGLVKPGNPCDPQRAKAIVLQLLIGRDDTTDLRRSDAVPAVCSFNLRIRDLLIAVTLRDARRCDPALISMGRESVMTTFTVTKQPGYGHILADASIKAKSSALTVSHRDDHDQAPFAAPNARPLFSDGRSKPK